MLCAVLLAGPAAAADPALDEALRTGDYPRAVQLADQHLARQPRDAQVRFSRALALSKMGRRSEAIAAFQALARDYPTRAEPHNNLAVLHADAGDLEKARAALEAAVKADPSHRQAQENLGDLYAKMASGAYDRAAAGGAAPSLAYKRQLQEQICAIPEEGALMQSPVTAAPAAASPTPESLAPTRIEGVAEAVERWRVAWESGDPEAYLAAYSSRFRPTGGMGLAAWQTQRREALRRDAERRITVESLSVSALPDDRAEALFVQQFSSPRYRDRVQKRLVLRRSADGQAWLIARESSLGRLQLP